MILGLEAEESPERMTPDPVPGAYARPDVTSFKEHTT